MRNFLPTSKWQHSKIYEYALAAEELHMLLSDFLLLEPEKQAFQLAKSRIKATMQGYNDYLAEKAAKRKS
jgi:hypothetical protein